MSLLMFVFLLDILGFSFMDGNAEGAASVAEVEGTADGNIWDTLCSHLVRVTLVRIIVTCNV